MFKIIKNNFCSLFFVFFFSVGIIPYVYGSSFGYDIKSAQKSKNAQTALDIFKSKCEDRSTNMKEIDEAYKALIKAVKISNKADVLSQKKFFDDFKEDFYGDISMSVEQQKDIEATQMALLKVMKARHKVYAKVIDALYKLAKTDRNYYKIKKSDVIDKAQKRYENLKTDVSDADGKFFSSKQILNDKLQTIRNGDNIFTRYFSS
ncbi:MAG: hypothetical protein LBB44_05195 [Endomicrobium sp.]|jgi:hypothetical protein|nr:hypothetical protein [Endomicrobium sp.]